jgi:hypothetical protein
MSMKFLAGALTVPLISAPAARAQSDRIYGAEQFFALEWEGPHREPGPDWPADQHNHRRDRG